MSISVLPKTVRISGPANSEMVAGKGDTFECVVSKANPKPNVFWLINGRKYNTVEYVNKVSSKYSPSLPTVYPRLNLRVILL